MSKKRVLVAGGAGFLGSHLCARLLEAGNDVVCLDNFYTGSKPNIAPLAENPRFEVVHHDVCFPINAEIDEIYNLACPASPVHYQENPVKTVKTCVLGAVNLLDLADRYDAKILQASTSEIYGDPNVHPQPETYWGNVNAIGLRSCYDEGKRCAETLFYDYHRQKAVNIRVMRIFNTYGPHMHPNDGRVVSNFIVQALRNKPITIYGDGSQTRSFCYCDDMIDGMIRLMNADDSVTMPINIGNPVEFTIMRLAQLVIELTGSRTQFEYLPLPQDDPLQRCPDIARAQDLLSWEPTIQLRDGLMRTIAYFEDLLHSGAEAQVQHSTQLTT